VNKLHITGSFKKASEKTQDKINDLFGLYYPDITLDEFRDILAHLMEKHPTQQEIKNYRKINNLKDTLNN
jgi:hypothetical protein